MCGIAGLMRLDGAAPDAALLQRMLDAIAHRGPDGEGMRALGSVALGQRRLAIIDLEGGKQPLIAADDTALVGNGEIYNYRELYADLPGQNFATHSDCELPLHLYRRFGLDGLDRLRGMYALAIHDAARDELVLARDPFGIKPLYYAEAQGHFLFASEPRALFASGLIAPALDAAKRDEMLQLQFGTGAETVWRGVMRLLPGEVLVLRGGRIAERRRRPALPASPPRALEEQEALQALDAALADSVTLHQRSDVPYGLFLSGGIDSSAMLAMMARLNSRPVRAFSVGFPDTAQHDERALAAALAKRVGADFEAVDFTAADFWALLPKAAWAMDDPAADYAILPTLKLAAHAARELKVVLSGEGGDEIFAGYGRYRSATRPFWQLPRPMRRHGSFDGLKLFRQPPRGWRRGFAASEQAAAREGETRLQMAQRTDMADWLPNDLLTKLDRCLMAQGLEGRTPFLDPVLGGFGFALPDGLKIRDGRGKHLLRAWLARHLPEAEPFSRKRGFTVPVGEWIAAEAGRLASLVAAQPGIAEAFDGAAVSTFLTTGARQHPFAAWALLFYACWHQHHVVGRAAEGDAFALLAAG